MLNLRALARENNVTQAYLAGILGITQSEVSKMMNGLRPIRKEHISIITEKFGEDVVKQYLNLKWQYKAEEAAIVPAEVVEEIREEVVAAESVPILSEDLSASTDLDIRAYIEDNGDELERINPSQMLQRADLAEKVMRTSMLPTFAPGDIVFIRFLKDANKIIDGEIYYFDLRSMPTMIRKVKIEGGKLRLVALNPNFGDIIISREDIVSVARIVGLLRMTFSDFYSDIEEVRKQKEEQIQSLIEQIDKSGERENRLIDIIEKNFSK